LESLLTRQADQELASRSSTNKLNKTVNNLVSFNVIKSYLIELFYLKIDLKQLFLKISQLFLTNPTYTGRNRTVNRKKTKPRQALNFHKRRVKVCF